MIAPVDAIKMLLSDANIVYFDITTYNGATHTIKLQRSGRYLLIYSDENDHFDYIDVYNGSIPYMTIRSIDIFAEKIHYL